MKDSGKGESEFVPCSFAAHCKHSVGISAMLLSLLLSNQYKLTLRCFIGNDIEYNT